jgi:hypothetical protein
MLSFDKHITQNLGILTQFPITLGGKIIYIDVMVAHNPLDFNFVLKRDYVNVMKALVSTLFQVMFFPQNRNIMTIDHISFISLHTMVNHPTSLNGPYMQETFAPPRVNYVATSCWKYRITERGG